MMKTAATTTATRARKLPLTACKGRAFHSSLSTTSSSLATTTTIAVGTSIIASSKPGVKIYSRCYSSCSLGNRRHFDNKHDNNNKLSFSSTSVGVTEQNDHDEHDDDVDDNEEQLPQEEDYNDTMNTKLRQECSTCPYRSQKNHSNDNRNNNDNNRHDETEIQRDHNSNDRSGSIVTESNYDYMLKQQQQTSQTKEPYRDKSQQHSMITTFADETRMSNTVIPCGEPPTAHDDNNYPKDTQQQPYHDVKYSVRRRVLKTSIPPVYSSSDDTTETSIPPFTMIPLNSLPGKQQLIDTLQQNTAASYMALTEHFTNQDDPAYCGITTLLVVLNALSMDPNVRWKGGWRYFANETVLLSLHPCISKYNVIQRSIGITMEQFHRIATCQGLLSIMKRPCTTTTNNDNSFSQPNNQLQQQQQTNHNDERELINDANRSSSSFGCTVDEFRNDIIKALSEHDDENDESTHQNDSIIVVSFHRASLYQTGEGHFSPIAAYHTASDTVLVLDVARFKYQPYWVSVPALYNAMIPVDTCTNLSRGWYILQRQQQQRTNNNNSSFGSKNNLQDNSQYPKETLKTTAMETKIEPTTETTKNATRNPEQPPPKLRSNWKSIITNEDMIPARLVPLAGQDVKNQCPVHSIKVNYCPIDQNFHK